MHNRSRMRRPAGHREGKGTGKPGILGCQPHHSILMRFLLSILTVAMLPACASRPATPDASLFPDTEQGNGRFAAYLIKFHEP